MKRLILVILAILFLTIPVAAHAAAVAPTALVNRALGIWGDWTVTWTGITTTNNTCTAYTYADRFSSINIQAYGTWGAAATLTFWGSNDGGTTWFALTALQTSSAMSLTANGHGTILSTPVGQIKWILAGGDANTSLTVKMKGQR